MLTGACLDWFAVQRFVEVEGPKAAIAWATPEAPMVCFQDINRGKWMKDLPICNGHPKRSNLEKLAILGPWP